MNIKVDSLDSKQRLDVFLIKAYDKITRSQIKQQIEKGKVLVNGAVVKAGYNVCEGDSIDFEEYKEEMLNASPEDIQIEVVYEDNDLAVINKKQGMVVHPSVGNKHGTLVNALAFRFNNLSNYSGQFRPGIVHRLDKDTSGLIIIAKNNRAHVNLAKQIEVKDCKRFYLALLEGIVKDDEGIIETNLARSKSDRKKFAVSSSLEGKKAVTLFKVIERFKNQTLVMFELKTGRTHQIRVHAQYIGHPVCADPVYGFKNSTIKNEGGQLLHAYKIIFTSPSSNKLMTFEAPLPDYFQAIVEKLQKQKGDFGN